MITVLIVIGVIAFLFFCGWVGILGFVLQILFSILGALTGSKSSGSSDKGKFGGGGFGGGGSSDDY